MLFPAATSLGCKKEEETDSLTIVLRDFEKYNPDFTNLEMSEYFGSIDVNTDGDYVKSGSQSAKLKIHGSTFFDEIPMLGIPFYSSLLGYNHKDLKVVESVGMAVYNAQDYEIELNYKFEFFDGQSTERRKINLQPGWNDVVMSIDLDVMNMFYNLGDCRGLRLSFKDFAKAGVDIDDAPVIYLDDLTLNLRATKYVPSEEMISVDPYEICSFEKAYQAYIMKSASSSNGEATTSVVGEDQGVSPTQGSKMLKVEFTVTSSGYPRLCFSSKLFPTIDFTRFKDDYQNYSIAYDVYNATEKSSVIANYYIWGGIKEWPNANLQWGTNMEAENYVVAPNVWQTYTIPLKTIYEWDENTIKDEFHMFLMFENKLAPNSTFYLDNFRIVKGA